MASAKGTRGQPRGHRAHLPVFRVEGESLSVLEDIYPFLLQLTWTRFFGLVTLVFLVLNLTFAGLYSVVPRCVENSKGFLDNFFFSVETLATIGYGEMTPNGTFAHVIVTLEALVGIGATAMMTGLIFARFARPTAQIVFSDHMVISTWNGVPHLMFRMANRRRNQLAEANVSIGVLLAEKTAEGHTLRRPTELQLVRSKNPMFALSWTAMHKIDETSPFYGGREALATLKREKADVYVALSGLDETLMQTVTARFRYAIDDILYGARFADIITIEDDGTRVVNYDKFHEVIEDPAS